MARITQLNCQQRPSASHYDERRARRRCRIVVNMPARSSTAKVTLQEAVTLLIQNQAKFVSEIAEVNRRHTELVMETKREIDEIKSVLHQMYEVILQLPEAVRQKIGFKSK